VLFGEAPWRAKRLPMREDAGVAGGVRALVPLRRFPGWACPALWGFPGRSKLRLLQVCRPMHAHIDLAASDEAPTGKLDRPDKRAITGRGKIQRSSEYLRSETNANPLTALGLNLLRFSEDALNQKDNRAALQTVA
jgi:hypothetical protein